MASIKSPYPRSMVTERLKKNVFNLKAQGVTNREIANRYGLSQSLVNAICHGYGRYGINHEKPLTS